MAFTAGGIRLYSSSLMLVIGVGTAEAIYGSWRAFATFFGIHLITLLTMGVAISIAAKLEWSRAELLFSAIDVGPSAGYYGCLGLVIASRKPRLRQVAPIVIMAVLVTRLGWSAVHVPDHGRVLSADLAHAIAFPLGVASARLRVNTECFSAQV